jgi:hypothetical protein
MTGTDHVPAMLAAHAAYRLLKSMPRGAGLVPCTCQLPPSQWPSMWPPGMRCVRHRVPGPRPRETKAFRF